MNKLGSKLRAIRESKGLLIRQVAASLDADTAYISKLERGERKAKREQLTEISLVLECDKEELLTLWLADQVFEIVKNEKIALRAIEMVKSELENR